jgi:hypothetical protein
MAAGQRRLATRSRQNAMRLATRSRQNAMRLNCPSDAPRGDDREGKGWRELPHAPQRKWHGLLRLSDPNPTRASQQRRTTRTLIRSGFARSWETSDSTRSSFSFMDPSPYLHFDVSFRPRLCNLERPSAPGGPKAPPVFRSKSAPCQAQVTLVP